MAQNNNPRNPTIPSHSRTISIIRNQNILSFMPKFLLKTLHMRKRSITNPKTMNDNKNHTNPGTKNDEKIGKIKRISKHFSSNNQLMEFLPVTKGATAIMSFIFKNRKQHDQEQRKDSEPKIVAKQFSKKWKSNKEGYCRSVSTSKNCMFDVGNVNSVTGNGRKVSRVKHVVKTGENVEMKGGLRMKRIIKIESREKRDQTVKNEFELCKKKILMGEKCRPLTGSLRYDEDGVLVPDILPEI